MRGRKRSSPAGTKTHLPFGCCPDLSICPGCVPVLPQATAPRNPGVAPALQGKVWGWHPNLLPSRFGRQDCFCRAGLFPLPEAFSPRPLTHLLSFQWGWDSPGSPTPAGSPPILPPNESCPSQQSPGLRPTCHGKAGSGMRENQSGFRGLRSRKGSGFQVKGPRGPECWQHLVQLQEEEQPGPL